MQAESTSDRPSSPPRSLGAILRSGSLTNDFRTYLADLDDDSGEGDLRVKWLNFVLSCRNLAEAHQRADKVQVKKAAEDLKQNYYSESNRVVLLNPDMWTAGKKCLESGGKKDPKALWKAHDEVLGKLDDLHQDFLLKNHVRAKGELPDLLQQCLLWFCIGVKLFIQVNNIN